MATNLKLDDAVLAEALRLSGFRTKREAVMEALTEYVAKRRRREILKLKGSIDFNPEYDYKAQRNRL